MFLIRLQKKVRKLIQIKCGITINVDVGAKNSIYVKKSIFGILLHVVGNMDSI